jgi:hypothetical protein
MSNSRNSRAAFSSEAIAGWLPWGALTPFLGAVLVVMAVAPALIALEHLQLLDTEDDPVGLKGLCAFSFPAAGTRVCWIADNAE